MHGLGHRADESFPKNYSTIFRQCNFLTLTVVLLLTITKSLSASADRLFCVVANCAQATLWPTLVQPSSRRLPVGLRDRKRREQKFSEKLCGYFQSTKLFPFLYGFTHNYHTEPVSHYADGLFSYWLTRSGSIWLGCEFFRRRTGKFFKRPVKGGF